MNLGKIHSSLYLHVLYMLCPQVACGMPPYHLSFISYLYCVYHSCLYWSLHTTAYFTCCKNQDKLCTVSDVSACFKMAVTRCSVQYIGIAPNKENLCTCESTGWVVVFEERESAILLQLIHDISTQMLLNKLLSARPEVTSPATQHHHPLAGTKLYCLVTEAHRCEQLA